MKSAFYGYRADVIGLLWLAAALFFSLILGSYYPLDPSFNSIGTFTQVRNKCGYLGSFLADILYQLFGLGAWVFVLLALRQSMLAFQNRLFVSSGLYSAGIWAFSVFVSSSLMELHQPERSFFQGHISPGGILGKTIVQNTLPYLHFAGLFLVFWSSALILFVLITKSSISSGFVKMVLALQRGGGRFAVILCSKGGRALVQMQKMCLASLLSLFSFRKRKKSIEQEASPSLFSRIPLIRDPNKETPFFSNVAVKKDYFFKEEEKEVENNIEKKENQESIQWKLPPADLLKTPPLPSALQMSLQESKGDAERLKRKLEQFSISGEIANIRSGPVITVFEFKPEDHVKVARITQMEDDLMIALKSRSIRIIAPIPGRDVVGIETAHTKRQMVYLKDMIKDPLFWQSEQPLPLVLGRHVDGRPAIKDLEKLPHLMVAGSTGSGKSVFVISFLLSLLFRHTPESLRLLLVDPKQVDLSVFAGLPHLLTPPVRESKEAVVALQWCLSEMYKRYRSLARFHVRDLVSFNEKTKKLKEEERQTHQDFTESLGEDSEELYYFSPQPYICVVLEEFGDLMSSPDRNRIETLVVRLAQMARACGIHLILSMQSPRKDVVTGLIKTNIPGRMSFKVSSRIDSRIILDEGGAERLLSQGDMLYLGPGQARPERYHGSFVKETEVLSVVQFWKRQAKTDFCLIKNGGEEGILHRNNEEISLEQDDNKYKEVFHYVSELKEVSASHLQRKYGLGYPRAARLIDRLEEEGVVGPARGSK
ncbi:MAG: DNA translocase FtsK 4TM domain-containing protein, partial [Bdellovibrionales bacterium]|nr:DNA translocase FtsK 4TM domain-containing protein [Bdellovibrionales bacterium]